MPLCSASAMQELLDLGESEIQIAPSKKYTDKLLQADDEKLAAAGRRFAGAVTYKNFVMQRRDMRHVKAALDAGENLKVISID